MLLVVVLGLCATPLRPALADNALTSNQAVEGRYIGLAADKIRLSGGQSYKIAERTKEAIKKVAAELAIGQGIRLLRSGGEVTAIEVVVQSFELDGTMEKTLEQSEGTWVLLKEGAQFQVAPDKLGRIKERLFFIKKGYLVRLTMFGYRVIDVQMRKEAMPPPRQQLTRPLRSAFKQLQKGDMLIVNGSIRGRLLSQDIQSIVINPELKEGGVKASKTWLIKPLIHSLENLTAKKRRAGTKGKSAAGSGVVGDVIDQRRIKVSDTIGVGLQKGVCTALSRDKLELHIWEAGKFVRKQTFPRRGLGNKVRRTSLSTTQRVKIGGAEVSAVCFRRRVSAEDELSYEVRLIHTREDSLLVGVGLQAVAIEKGQNRGVGPRYQLRPIFPREPLLWKRVTKRKDPYLQMLLQIDPAINVISIKSDAAVEPIAAAVYDMRRTDRLLRAYDALAANANPLLIRAMIERCVSLDTKKSAKQLIVETLQNCIDATAAVLMDDLTRQPKDLHTVRLLETGTISEDELGIPAKLYWKRRLRLFAQLRSVLNAERARILFDLYIKHKGDDIGKTVVEALRAHAGDAVRAVADIASSMKPNASKQEIRRIETAASLLELFGKAAIEPMCKVLDDIGQNKAADEIRGELESQAAQLLIRRAIEVILGTKRAERRRQNIRIIRKASSLARRARKTKDKKAARGQWLQAAAMLDKIPGGYPQLRQLLPEVYLNAGICERAIGERGRAFEYLERGLKHAKKAPKVRTKLLAEWAGIIAESVNEEAAAVVLRSGPGDAYSKVHTLPLDALVKIDQSITANNPDWLPVFFKDQTVWVRRLLIDHKPGTERGRVQLKARSVSELRPKLDKARSIAPGMGAVLDTAEAEITAREALDNFLKARYPEALKAYDKLLSIDPNHPGLDRRLEAWFMVNWTTVIGIFAVFVVFGGILIRSLFNRQRLVIRPDEYMFYGRDRINREREFE